MYHVRLSQHFPVPFVARFAWCLLSRSTRFWRVELRGSGGLGELLSVSSSPSGRARCGYLSRCLGPHGAVAAMVLCSLPAQVARPRDCTMCRECIREPGWSDKISLHRKADHFIFGVESVGMLPPKVSAGVIAGHGDDGDVAARDAGSAGSTGKACRKSPRCGWACHSARRKPSRVLLLGSDSGGWTRAGGLSRCCTFWRPCLSRNRGSPASGHTH